MNTALERIEAWQAAARAGREVSLRDGLVREVREGDALSGYGYGAHGELTSIVDPDGTRWEYAYEPDGRLVSVTKAGEKHARYCYDSEGRLLEVDRKDGPKVHFYDAGGRLVRTLRGDAGFFGYRYDGNGRVTSARCDHEETRFGYDDRGRVTSVEQAADGLALEARFEFAGLGRLARTCFPAWGIEIRHAWDEKGRPLSLSWSAGSAKEAKEGQAGGEPAAMEAAEGNLLARFGYDEAAEGGKLSWCETGDGLREETWHDTADGRPMRKVLRRGAELLWEKRMEYGAGFRLEKDGDRAYRYDELGRLAGAEEGPLHWRYSYTIGDDIAEAEAPEIPAPKIEIDAGDRIRGLRRGRNERVYRYNQAGEMLESLENGNSLARCRYDHKGRLLLKRSPAGTERYLYAADDGLLAVTDAAGSPRRIHLRLPTGLVGVIDFTADPGGEPVFFHNDGRGNLVFAGRADGPLEGPFSADPFGAPLSVPARLPYLHREKAYHADLGLYWIGCRWYDPALRRFLTPDSYTGGPDDERLVNPFITGPSQRGARAQILGEWLKQPRVRNRHAYCGNDPVNRFDPNGHWSFGGVLLSLLGAIWTLPNTLFGIAVEITCLVGEVVRWLVWLFSGGSASWQTPGIDTAASGRLNAFALVFTGGWLGSFDSLLGITFGNVFFVNKEWKQNPAYQGLPANVAPPAYNGAVTISRDDALYEHELRHVNQYAWFGPFFHLGLPLFGVYEWDVIFNGYQDAWLERNAREHSGF